MRALNLREICRHGMLLQQLCMHAPLILLLKMLNLNSRSHLITIEGARSIFGSVHACYLVWPICLLYTNMHDSKEQHVSSGLVKMG